ncbi:MAG TPA: hypothetical protein VMU19_07880 [Bryobacteraceae bacterium]|nr:hypothetical protein [Bryobacteraceae bacterium]
MRIKRLTLGALAAACATLSAQQLLSGPDGKAIPIFSDVAILDEDTPRKDLPCTVTPVKPELGFDFRFSSGYRVNIPLKELSDEEGRLTMVFRVTPTDHPGDPVYLSQHVPVPEIDADAKGDAELGGAFSVGEGKYHVSWLMRGRTERVCSSSWDIEASLPARDKPMPLDIAPDAVLDANLPAFRPEPRPAGAAAQTGLRLRVLMNYAPQDTSAAVMAPNDSGALLAILRTMSRDPRAASFSLVVFNAQEQRIVYRQDEAARLDLPAMGRALRSLKLGRVDAKLMAEKHSEAEFLGSLFIQEIAGNPEPPDAVIIAGPKAALEDSLPAGAQKQLGDVKIPVFYLNCNFDPTVNPWRDAISGAVRAMRGVEYTIAKPRDVYFAWSDIASHIVKSKVGTSDALSAAPKP